MDKYKTLIYVYWKTEILPFLVYVLVHSEWCIVWIRTLHIGLFICFTITTCNLFFLNDVCVAEVFFGVFRSLGLFHLGITGLTYKRDVWNLGSWKSVLSFPPETWQLQSEACPVVRISCCFAVLWESSIWWGHSFKFDFAFPWFWRSCHTLTVNWL